MHKKKIQQLRLTSSLGVFVEFHSDSVNNEFALVRYHRSRVNAAQSPESHYPAECIAQHKPPRSVLFLLGHYAASSCVNTAAGTLHVMSTSLRHKKH